MPSEDLPPLAPFPDLAPPAPRVPEAPAAAMVPAPKAAIPSLLSEAQRREFARAAGSLDGRESPAAPSEEPAVDLSEGFFSPAASDTMEMGQNPGLLPEEPVPAVDFLALPGSAEYGEPLTAPDERFSLQTLAAALAVNAPLPQGPAPAAEPVRPGDEWDLSAFLTGPEPCTPPPRPVPVPVVQYPDSGPLPGEPEPLMLFPPSGVLFPEAEPVAPLLPGKVPAAGIPAPVYSAAPAAGEPVVLFPQFPPPRQQEPESVYAETPDLLFPPVAEEKVYLLPPADEPAAAAAAVMMTAPPDVTEPEEAGNHGISLVLGGVLLIVTGMLLACTVPVLGLMAETAAVSAQAAGAVQIPHLHGGMFLALAGTIMCLFLGIGAIMLRRWAPPLIHAASWVVLLTVLVSMGTVTASAFYLSSQDTGSDSPGFLQENTLALSVMAVAGIALPLGLIAIFQRPSASFFCQQMDRKPRWTDERSVPALMVYCTGLFLALAALALAVSRAGMPLFGQFQEAGTLAWAGVGTAAATAAILTGLGRRAGWWMLLALSMAVTVSLFLTFREHHWHRMFHLPVPGGVDSGSIAGGVLAATAMLPALIILLMTRRAFSHPPDHHHYHSS